MSYRTRHSRYEQDAAREFTSYRFDGLNKLGAAIGYIGWAALVLSVLLGLYGVAALEEGERLAVALSGFGGAVSALLVVALGGVMRCLVAVEENTRQVADPEAA